MLINWFTVAAQVINFLVLVWLLKHFLYKRVIGAINSREGKIAARMAEAQTQQQAAAEQLALYQAKLADFEKQRDAMFSETRLSADKLHAELTEKARAHAQELETKWREDLEREQEVFLQDLRSRAVGEIIAIARRMVADLACLDVEQCAVRTFLAKLPQLDSGALAGLGSGDLFIRSAFELPEDARAELRGALEQLLATPVHVEFEHAPDLGLGIELRGNGRRIGWNSESYLDALERDLKETLEHTQAGVP